ncbi:MAG: nitroreductase family protein [Rhodobacterales bacterium]|nr:nitroreductase family protein [Rhodobacterales bacterium]
MIPSSPAATAATGRVAGHPVDPLFLNRWSPRAFDGAPMPRAHLLTILEAARWAPSAFNIQPWRFVHAHRDDPAWDTFVGLLDPFNGGWAHRAAALVVVLSDTLVSGDGTRPDRPSSTHAFDAGAAWAQMALQATALGYQAHAMAGIERDAIRAALGVPERFHIPIAVALGRAADPVVLPETLRAREVPSDRLPLDAIAFAGAFPAAGA